MELNKSNLKKIRGIIVFTAIVIACFWKYDVVFAILKFAFGILFPFDFSLILQYDRKNDDVHITLKLLCYFECDIILTRCFDEIFN